MSARGISIVCLIVGAALTAQGVLLRVPGWNPPSLLLDDQWVGAVATRMTIPEYFAFHPPVPAGFALLLGVLARLLPNLESSLQLVPVLGSVAQIPLVGWLLVRITGQPVVGVLGAAMVVVDPHLSTFGVRVKPYASDGALAIALLLLAAWVAERPGVRPGLLLAVAAVAAALFSFPALFVGASLLGAFCLRDLFDRGRRPPGRLAWLVAPLVFLGASGLVYLVLLRGAARQSLITYWRSRFLPLGDVADVWEFVATRGVGLLTAPFPDSLAWLALLVPVGLTLLLRRSSTRWLGVAVVLLGTQLLVASALRLYPTGGGRTDLFVHGILIVLACSALLPLDSRQPRWWQGVAVVAAVSLALGSARPSRYPPRRDAELVRRAHAVLRPTDMLLLHPAAGLAVALYWPAEVRLVAHSRGSGFTAEVGSHRSLTLDGKGTHRRPAVIRDRLIPFLKPPGERIVYLATNVTGRIHPIVVGSILDAGYEVESRKRGPVAALIVFRRPREPS